jgi:hypothetical protein
MKTIITKGKLLKGDKVEVEFIEKDDDGNPAECSKSKNSPPPAQSLRVAFSNLSIHAAILAEFINSSSINDIAAPEHPDLEKFSVSGFTIVGGEKMEGVILTGAKTLKNGKALIFNTPITRFEDQSENAYDYTNDLLESIETARVEIQKYLDGHHATDPQQELPFQ